MKNIGLIPRSRLKNIPEKIRINHELCFFLHDECLRVLVEYENAEAHIETIQFTSTEESKKFVELAKNSDTVEALRKLGFHNASKTVVVNTISMAMISDALNHIYEALMCFEKRKMIVGLNLLRKPLKESLLYLAFIHGSCDDFFDLFTRGDSKFYSPSSLGNKRRDILESAIQHLDFMQIFDATHIENTIYSRQNNFGFEAFCQHAVHLVTIRYEELKTSPENFNFIFRDPLDDEIYHLIYDNLPYILLFMSHVVIGIFNKMQEMDFTSKHLFHIKTIYLYDLIAGTDKHASLSDFKRTISTSLCCPRCSIKCKITLYNAVNLLLHSRLRCTICRTSFLVPLFSYPESIDWVVA